MCGLVCSLGAGGLLLDFFDRLCEANAQRGPDAQQTKNLDIANGRFHMRFFASELLLRGNSPVFQPHEEDGDIFCWNGEVFSGLDVLAHENDGTKLFQCLRKANDLAEIQTLLASIEGPYAFAFYSKVKSQLIFGRDPLGRRSLLIHQPVDSQPYFLLASVSAGQDPGYQFEELDTTFLFALDVDSLSSYEDVVLGFAVSLKSYPRTLEFFRVNPQLPSVALPLSFEDIATKVDQSVSAFIQVFDDSVKRRVVNIPGVQSCQAGVAVLFSGGIDSTFVAALAHRHIPVDQPIDLLNVAFENPRKNKGLKDQKNPQSYMVPDRLSGQQEVLELSRLYPERKWNFVAIDIPYAESQSSRSTIEALLAPQLTVMDLSLGLSLYFASRGTGYIRDESGNQVEYHSPARVLLSGLGSDELLGGYGRHRTAFTTGGWGAVVEELQLELSRIPTRNLGRDDRVISSHGKETRYPFLSLNVVDFLAGLPVSVKMEPRLDVGYGDKMLLRLAARKLGLLEASRRKKKAMQFGSWSARMDGEKRGDAPL